ncbi:MAG: flagellar M-ring protein FliF [Dehalococcoidia bacterium]|nr:flagellar M-ring protein FliF [Dehalococcoidia bacterium]
MGQSLGRVTEMWGSLSPVRKGLLTAAGVGLVALLFLVYSWSGRTEYVTLYTGLGAADSGEVVEQLRSQVVPYELEAGGATIRVPAGQADELRVDFATQGLPTGGQVGFELFEGSSFTATDFVQRLNFQRGLQGELARTIESFPDVQQARVHLVLPERSLFVEDQSPATASVVVSLRPGRSMAAGEVDGIAHLVAGAVEGLAKDHITVLDERGVILYDGAQLTANDGLGLSTSQLTLQQQYEQRLEADVQSMLDRALGPAKSAVSVAATLNFDQVERQSETYTSPENGTARSTSTVTEQYTTADTEGAGQIPGALTNVPGANANLPTVETETGTSTGTNYSRTESTSNFEVDKVVTVETEAPGRVERLSVSLLLDESVPEAQATSLQASVAAAVGINEDRGDQMVLTRVPFDRTAIEEANAAFASDASTDQLFAYARLILPVVMLFVGFLFFQLLVRSVKRRAVRAYDVGPGYPALAMAGGAPELGDAVSAMRALPQPEEVRRSDLEMSIEKMARNNPESITEVVQAWLRED